MNNEHPAPPPPAPRIVVPRTTTSILKQTTSVFSTTRNLLMLLLLSFFLLFLRASVETVARFLNSFIDDVPSLKSAIDRRHGPFNSASSTTAHHPFRQSTPVETLDNEFDSGFFYSSLSKPRLNETSFIPDSFDPQLGFSNFGIRASETVRSGSNVTFRLMHGPNDSFNEPIVSKPDFWSLWFDLDYNELTSVFFFCGTLSVTYWYVVLGVVIVTYAWFHGIIFVMVLNDFCKRQNSFSITFSNGSILGKKRLYDFIFVRWMMRELFTQVMSFWFFQSITDPYTSLKIKFTYIRLMPFSFMCFWDKVHEKDILAFLASWVLLDLFISYIYAVTDWIIMADPRKSSIQVLKEGFHLLSLRIYPAINLKVFEVIVCGPFTRLVLAQTCGELLAFQSFMEVYFMVAWMVYYLSVKSIDAESRGRPFGQRELEAMVVDFDEDTCPYLQI